MNIHCVCVCVWVVIGTYEYNDHKWEGKALTEDNKGSRIRVEDSTH